MRRAATDDDEDSAGSEAGGAGRNNSYTDEDEGPPPASPLGVPVRRRRARILAEQRKHSAARGHQRLADARSLAAAK